MIIAVGNWTIQKADNGKENDKVFPVRLVANSLSPDRENEEILPQAFNKATVDDFVKNGIIDWHHQSVTGKTQEDRARAILGRPYGFQWENGLPVVYGNLTKSHPIVKESILPHLEAEQPVFGASVGGGIRKAHQVVDGQARKKTQITEIIWNHLAIAALPYVISPGTAVSMVKAYGSESNDVFIQFSDFENFSKRISILNSEDAFHKAFEAGFGTDISSMGGFDALRGQSLEGYSNHKNIVSQIIMGVTDGTITPTSAGVKEFLSRFNLSRGQISEVMKEFRETVRGFVAGKLN